MADEELFARVSNAPLFEVDGREVFRQMLIAVSHIHRLNVANRDIKLENWLMKGHPVPEIFLMKKMAI